MGNFILLLIGIAIMALGSLIYFKYKERHP